MPSIYRPTWNHLRAVLSAAAQRALVCSPYITTSGINYLFDALPSRVGLELLTRLSPSDWASGVSDPEALLTLLSLWQSEGNPTSLHVVQRLHAKVYSADDARVIVGSSNLSEGGFDHNIELVVELSGSAAADAIGALRAACSPYARQTSLDALEGWIERSRDAVAGAKAAAAEEPERLSGVQADLDQMLGFGNSSPIPLAAALTDIGPFVSWLDARRALPGAEVILNRHRNISGQNLTGHVKQCFVGAVRFFQEHPEFVAAVSGALDELSEVEVYSMGAPGLREAWAIHLDEHALDRGESYSYPTLRGILPPSLGGTRQGGGGGISSLKRLLPLVARYLREGHPDDSR